MDLCLSGNISDSVCGWAQEVVWNCTNPCIRTQPRLCGSSPTFESKCYQLFIHCRTWAYIGVWFWLAYLDWPLRMWDGVQLPSPTLCDLVDSSMPGFPVHHHFPNFAQTHVHWVGDGIQPSHPLSPPSPPALNLSHHQGEFATECVTYLNISSW